MKTEIDIKDDIYRHLKDSALVRQTSGRLIKVGHRPLDARGEDIVISVLESDMTSERQEALVQINVYVADQITPSGESVEDTARLRTLSRLAGEALNRVWGEGYRFTLQKQRIHRVAERREHCIASRVLYQYINER